MQRTILILAVAAVAAATVPALAAEPSTGTVSLASPTVSWTGAATGYGIVPSNILVTATGEDPLCPPQACDTFTLTVADEADLRVTAANRGGENFTELHVRKPDGETLYVLSADGAPATVAVKKAPKGEYVVEVLTNEPVGSDGEYDASATLGTRAPLPAQPTPNAPAPPPPAPAEDPTPTLSLATKSLSARRVKRSLKLGIGSTAPVTRVTAALRKGRRVLARGKLGSLGSRGTVRIRLKKPLKPGKYSVVLAAKDSAGRSVALSAPLRVRR